MCWLAINDQKIKKSKSHDHCFVATWTSSSSSNPVIGFLGLFGIGYPPIGSGAASG